jgi:hypothetical protein
MTKITRRNQTLPQGNDVSALETQQVSLLEMRGMSVIELDNPSVIL